jgi:hypothetical protein
LSLRQIGVRLRCSKDTIARELAVAKPGAAALEESVEDVPSWPPPADEGTVWVERPLLTGRTVRCREVMLWGRLVVISEGGLVHCPHCLELVDVAELGRIDNGHPVGLPYRVRGRLLPMPGHGEEFDPELDGEPVRAGWLGPF